VREAVFSSLLSHVGTFAGARVLDLFAGSGALGIEALSRGAAHATFVERDRAALETVRRNLSDLGLNHCSTVVPGDAHVAAERTLRGDAYALLLLDPPYRIPSAEVNRIIELLAAREMLTAEAVVMWEHGTSASAEWPEGFSELATKRYGDTSVSIARRGGGDT
jgi:16S rRNA (guanine966-N2)-methyltransferase